MTVSKQLDRLDLRMLEVLQKDGRTTNKELAELVNLSPSACHQRLQKLINDGWISGFTGRINIERLCAPVQCIAAVSLNSHSPEAFYQIEQRVMDLPEALEAFTVSGNCDFMIRFACTHMTRYMAITSALIENCPEIENIRTYVIMKQSKTFQGFPMKELMTDRAPS